MEVVAQSQTESSQPDNSFVNEVQLKKNDRDIYTIIRNGNPLRCIRPNENLACNSNCPLFEMDKRTDKILVNIHCGGTPLLIKIGTEIIPHVKQPTEK